MNTLAIKGGTPLIAEPFPVYPYYKENVKQAVARVADSAVFCSMIGTEVREFEKAFAGYNRSEYAVGMANGTLAIQCALSTLGIGAGDEVIIPAYTYVASASAAVAQNAIPVFADCETVSEGIDPARIEDKITDRTKAIMPVHMNGYPCDMDSIMNIAKKHNLKVIEDCSHAHGAAYKGRNVGTIGDIGAFSLQHKKNLSVGEGGICITDSREYYDEMQRTIAFGDGPMVNNYRLSEFHGAVGTEQLKELDNMNKTRRANAEYLQEKLTGLPGLSFLKGYPDTEKVYYNFIVLYSEEEMEVPRGTFVDALKTEGVPMNIFYIPLNHHPVFKDQDAYGRGCPFACPLYGKAPEYSSETYPNAEHFCYKANLEVKVHPPCGKKEMDLVADAFKKVLDNIGELKETADV